MEKILWLKRLRLRVPFADNILFWLHSKMGRRKDGTIILRRSINDHIWVLMSRLFCCARCLNVAVFSKLRIIHKCSLCGVCPNIIHRANEQCQWYITDEWICHTMPTIFTFKLPNIVERCFFLGFITLLKWSMAESRHISFVCEGHLLWATFYFICLPVNITNAFLGKSMW